VQESSRICERQSWPVDQGAKGAEMDLLSKAILKDVNLDEVMPKKSEPKNPVDHWSPAVLLERAAYLRKLARHGDGSASETLKEYPQHFAMLSFRSRDGEAEVHEQFADLFCVLAGKATLVTGGIVKGARAISLGETRGTAIEGGEEQTLRAGDVVHIPAAIPHHMLVKGQDTITYLVLKVQEVL
jgi:mannose-6-phosphate isomerase-like protein (cupin superfamily)